MADDPLQQIQAFCETHEVRRLEAEEILELLADGEEPGWVAGQAADDRPDVAAQLTTLLAAIAPDVAPESADDEILTEAPAAEPTEEVPADADEAPPVDAQAQLADLAQHLPPGVDARQLQQMLSSPRGQMLADFGAFCEEQGYQGDDESVMQAAHEEWLQTPRESLEGKKPADVLEGGRLLPGKVETFRREAPKVGRNDPCPCGSGKKYKKCHGKGG
jgi:hypothetical protein